MYVGEGGIDVASILAHIPRCVYSIELPNKERHEEIGRGARNPLPRDAEGVLAEHSGDRSVRDKRRSGRATSANRRTVAPY